MNKVILMGRLTKEPVMRYTQGENPTAVTRFNLAVDRRAKDNKADFINCVAFGKTAEFVDKHFTKGNRMICEGRIQTGSYQDKDGKTVYTTDIAVEVVEFCENKKDAAPAPEETPSSVGDGFMNIPDDFSGDDLPFN